MNHPFASLAIDMTVADNHANGVGDQKCFPKFHIVTPSISSAFMLIPSSAWHCQTGTFER